MHPKRTRFLALVVVSCLAVSSCSPLPGSGPGAGAIENVAQQPEATYTLVNVTQRVADLLSSSETMPLANAFGGGAKPRMFRIGVGDVVTVSIWEASENGLFSAGGARPGGSQIPEQVVSEDGSITVPYAGTIKVAGRTSQEVKLDIEKSLSRMAVEPQVLVNVVKNNSSAVTVTGEVNSSGRYPLSPGGGNRLVDVIAMAGGPRIAAHQLAVQISRGAKTETLPLEQLISSTRDNIFLQPNDIITLVRQPRSFTVFGAAISNASVPFDESELYLNQALAKVGGLNDNRANAKGLFVYRRESTSVVRSVAGNVHSTNADGTVNVIYQIDLRDPAGFFVLKSFKVKNRDLIYVANSSLAEVRKFSLLVNASVSPLAQAASAASRIQGLND